MIEDKELDKILPVEEIKESSLNISLENQNPPLNLNKINLNTKFSQKMDEVKQNVLLNASTTDDNFVNTVKKNVKEAAVRLTEVEKEKANLEGKQVELEQDKVTTKQNKEKHEQNSDDLENKRKIRQFHYEGVKPIMEFANIQSPMNLVFLYILAFILTPLFLINKFCKCTFGVLLTGANDKERGKAAKGFLWTLLAIFSLLIVICLIYLFLKTQGIDIFANIKS